MFSVSCAVLTSAASARSFKDFFSRFGSSTLRHPIHLQLAEHGILAYKDKKKILVTIFNYFQKYLYF